MDKKEIEISVWGEQLREFCYDVVNFSDNIFFAGVLDWGSWMIKIISAATPFGGALEVGTDVRARRSNHSENLKASGTVLGWRHYIEVCGETSLIRGHQAAERSNLLGILGSYLPFPDLFLLHFTGGMTGGAQLPRFCDQVIATGTETRRQYSTGASA